MSDEARKIKRGLLGTAIVVMMYIAGRGISNVVDRIKDRREARIEEAEEREWRVADSIRREERRVADSTRRAKEQQRDDYYKHVRDSVMMSSGAKPYEDSLRSLRGSYHDEDDIRDIEWAHALGRTIEDELIKTGWPIIEQGEQNIRDMFSLYDLRYDNFFTKDPDEYGYYNFFNELFVGMDSIADDMWGFGATDKWQNHVDTIIGRSDYGDMRKKEISQKAASIIANTENRLVANRKKVEERFADYYLGYDNQLGVDYSEGEAYPSYDAVNYIGAQEALITVRSVSVYDQNLDIDFFGEPGAKYKLLSHGAGKWQVVKERPNGVIEKTPIFKDNVSFETRTNAWSPWEDENGYQVPMPKVGDSEFSFSAGANLGVRINFSEVVKVAKKKVWKPQYTAAEQRQIDSLRQQLEMKRRWREKTDDPRWKADSVARVLTTRRFGSRGQ